MIMAMIRMMTEVTTRRGSGIAETSDVLMTIILQPSCLRCEGARPMRWCLNVGPKCRGDLPPPPPPLSPLSLSLSLSLLSLSLSLSLSPPPPPPPPISLSLSLSLFISAAFHLSRFLCPLSLIHMYVLPNTKSRHWYTCMSSLTPRVDIDTHVCPP